MQRHRHLWKHLIAYLTIHGVVHTSCTCYKQVSHSKQDDHSFDHSYVVPATKAKVSKDYSSSPTDLTCYISAAECCFTSYSLQAAAAAQPGDTASAAADTHAQDKQPAAATAVRPLRASCPAGRAPPQEPSTHRRQSRRHSTGPGQGHSAAAPANFAAPSDAAEEEEDLAAVQEMASGQLTDRRESLATSDQGAAGLHAGKQEKADPHSPAVTAQRHQHRSKGSLKADWRQGRASLSSPVAGTGGPRQHRRASLGGGGVLPLAGHSFLLTAYDDDKQKKVVTQRITHLGGCVLEDIPKPPVLTRLTGHLMCAVQPCFAFVFPSQP